MRTKHSSHTCSQHPQRIEEDLKYLEKFPSHVELVQLPGGGGRQLDVQRRQLGGELVDDADVLAQRGDLLSEGLRGKVCNAIKSLVCVIVIEFLSDIMLIRIGFVVINVYLFLV